MFTYRRSSLMLPLIVSILVLAPLAAYPKEKEAFRTLPVNVYLDKLRGAWAGQMIGVSYGSIYEFKWLGHPYTDPLRTWQPNFVANSIHQDDLYVEMTFLAALEEHGIHITSQQAGVVFGESQYELWHANLAARDNIRAGIPAPDSGHPKYNIHCDDIDFQIEADFCGILCPGLFLTANDLCDRFGHVMNYGDGVYGGMFVAGMYAAAYFEDDPVEVFLAGMKSIPAESEYGQVLQLVYDNFKQDSNDWLKAWQAVEDKWGNDDTCPDGKDRPFNIDAKINGAYIAIGMLYGHGDFEKSMEVSTRCGQDADCNPSNVAGVLGTMLGYNGIPEQFTSGLAAIENENFSYTNYNFGSLTETCLELTKQLVKDAGGPVLQFESNFEKTEIFQIPYQEPQPPKKLEQYTDEMQKTLAPAQAEHQKKIEKMHAIQLAESFNTWSGGWDLESCWMGANVGIFGKYLGRDNIFMTHPLQEQPCTISRAFTLPSGTPKLHLEVSAWNACDRADFVLCVYAGSEKLYESVICFDDPQNPWKQIDIDLTAYSGKVTELRIETAANGWACEGAFWDKIEIR